MRKNDLDLPTIKRIMSVLEKAFRDQAKRNFQYKEEILKAIENHKKRIDARIVALREKLAFES